MMSSKLMQVFNALPPEAQQMFVEKHMATLLDLMPKDRSKKIIAAATRLQKKYAEVPKLDLRVKREQITHLLNELTRDAKMSFIKERSNRDELLAEIIHSLVSWLNDIWKVVYENHVNFLLAHTCLLFVADALAQLAEVSILGQCKCSVLNLPVDFSLKGKSGKVAKRFSVVGPQNINRILLWIWRDLFVTLLADGTEKDKKRVPDFLEDIESVLGVSSLERLLYGGKPSEDDDEDEDEGDFDDEDDEDEDENLDHECFEGSDYDSEESDERCPCHLHATYWPDRINRARIPLRDLVEKRLFSIFEVAPTVRLYNTLLAISHDSDETEDRISRLLDKSAGDTPDTLVAALDIHILNGDVPKISVLLKAHAHLLRPRDTTTLQCAVAMLDNSHYHTGSLAILEKELDECIRAIYATVRSCFSHIEEEENKKDLLEIFKLKSGTASRKDRVTQWAERVVTSSNGHFLPMAFAALMMGLPMMPGADEGDDADFLNFVDSDQNDPDLDDLREEYKPNLKAIFDSWVHIGQTMRGGPSVLSKMYSKAVALMPWLRGSDVVNEMVIKLRERPNKGHVLEALVNLSSFAKMQRKKMNMAQGDQRRAGGKTQAGNTQSPRSHPSSSSTGPPPLVGGAFPFSLVGTSFPPVPGGMEDVD
ncbi:hypothetical protein M413DRAFT_444401 [Hebeloma cylindrosporum]|uniref:Uncharacterized protein n=1 Tax=Hebeloma cylindrosporum TaxID=76867 RepID=A0A0C2XYN6_HEBCY|nr:hypothetical protein M413DRAFT_444401 [Hebeloma cylindrosporum h7]